MAVVPADRRIDLRELREALGRHLVLASESELEGLFPDCSAGAIPPVGEAYGIRTFWDPSLGDMADVYFEGGDHRTLVHMDGPTFEALMRPALPLPHTLH
jgi:Ala-tRNA(Pro) deacylase